MCTCVRNREVSVKPVFPKRGRREYGFRSPVAPQIRRSAQSKRSAKHRYFLSIHSAKRFNRFDRLELSEAGVKKFLTLSHNFMFIFVFKNFISNAIRSAFERMTFESERQSCNRNGRASNSNHGLVNKKVHSSQLN
jgi:hypothetical protein